MENTSPGSPLPPPAHLMQLTMGYMLAQAVTVAAKLKLADQLSDGPKSAEEIAAATDSHAPSVYRLLRALVSAGLFC
jgi:predicted transcriptional regulator